MQTEERTVRENVRVLRVTQRLTQRRLAQASSWSPTTISLFERGRWTPQWNKKQDFLRSIAAELGVDVECLLEGVRDPDWWTARDQFDWFRKRYPADSDKKAVGQGSRSIVSRRWIAFVRWLGRALSSSREWWAKSPIGVGLATRGSSH